MTEPAAAVVVDAIRRVTVKYQNAWESGACSQAIDLDDVLNILLEIAEDIESTHAEVA